MADRVGVILKGEIILVEDKTTLMKKLGKRELALHLNEPLAAVPAALADLNLELQDSGSVLVYRFDAGGEATGISRLLNRLGGEGIGFHDLKTSETSLEEIFVSLVKERA
jgi:ABC-2 type transport system ATP-binding protein